MSRRPARQALQRRREELARSEQVTQLRRVAGAAALAAAVAALVVRWDRLFPVPPEKLLTVYWTHECECAHTWIRSLESEGFVVRDFETEDLRGVRGRLGTPEMLRGCHVGTFLRYFVDGHVPAAALRRLAAERPVASGISLEADVTRHTYRLGAPQDSVLLFDADGEPVQWP